MSAPARIVASAAKSSAVPAVAAASPSVAAGKLNWSNTQIVAPSWPVAWYSSAMPVMVPPVTRLPVIVIDGPPQNSVPSPPGIA